MSRLKIKKFHVVSLSSIVAVVAIVGIAFFMSWKHPFSKAGVNNPASPATSNGVVKSSSSSNTTATIDQYRILKLTASENDQGAGTPPPSSILQEQSEHFSVIIDGPTDYAGKIAQMHAWANDTNSTNGGNLSVLTYTNGSHVGGCNNAKGDGSIAVDAAGSYLHTASNYPNSYMMDITNSKWWSTISGHIQTELSSDGYDGIWVDLLGPESLSSNYNAPMLTNCTTAPTAQQDPGPFVPVNPANGRAYSSTEWIAGGASTLAAIKSAIGNHKLGFNGNRPAGGTYDSDPLLTNSDIGMTENWLLGEDHTTVASVSYWKSMVDELVHAGQLGKQLQAYVKMPGVTGAQQDITHKFALASFLLGTDGNQLFQFRVAHDFSRWMPVTPTHPSGLPWYQNLLIGHPSGGYTAVGGQPGCNCIYTRNFTQGVVFVNPTSSTLSAPLTGSFTDLDLAPKTYSSQITLASNTAEILLNKPTTPAADNPPTVALTSPNNNATVSGSAVTLSATATDNDQTPVQSVKFEVGSTVIATINNSPYSMIWNSTTVGNGSQTLTAIATDTANHSSSSSITVTVSNASAGSSPGGSNNSGGNGGSNSGGNSSPGGTVALNGGADPQPVSGIITLTPPSNDPNISKITYTVDGQTVNGDTLDTTKLSNGQHIVSCIEQYKTGQIIICPNTTITVRNKLKKQWLWIAFDSVLYAVIIAVVVVGLYAPLRQKLVAKFPFLNRLAVPYNFVRKFLPFHHAPPNKATPADTVQPMVYHPKEPPKDS